jgi:hypothetical protein
MSLNPDTHLYPSELPGAITATIFAFLSTSALLSVALRVVWLALSPRFLRNGGVKSLPPEASFFRTRMGIYATCLLTGNLFSSVAGVIGTWWLAKRNVVEGPVCTTQAIFMSMGNIAGAYFTVAIAIHTFNSLVLRFRQSAWIGILVISIGWAVALSVSLIPLSPALEQGSMYGPGDLTCGVRSIHLQALFYHHLFPILLASILSAVLYSLIFLVLRGTLVLRGGVKINLNPDRRWTGELDNLQRYHRFVQAIAKSMLWYPIAYIVLLLPYSITRLLGISGFDIPTGLTMFAFSCWYMLGIVNVLLLYNTFRILAPAFELLSPSRFDGMLEDGRMPSMMKQNPPLNVPPPIPTRPDVDLLTPQRSIFAPSEVSSTRDLLSRNRDVASTRYSFASYLPSPTTETNTEPVVISEPTPSFHAEHSRANSVHSTLSLTSAFEYSRSNGTQYPAFGGPSGPNREVKIKRKDSEPQNAIKPPLRDRSLLSALDRLNVAQNKPNTASLPPSPEELDISDWLAQQAPEDFVPPPRRHQQSGRPKNLSLTSRTSITVLSPDAVPSTSDSAIDPLSHLPIIRALPPTPYNNHRHDESRLSRCSPTLPRLPLTPIDITESSNDEQTFIPPDLSTT